MLFMLLCVHHEVPLLSFEALHHLHVFIFVSAIVHVTFSVLTVVFGGARIRQWKKWEDSIAKDSSEDSEQGLRPKLTHVQDHDFINSRFLGIEKHSSILGWMAIIYSAEHVIRTGSLGVVFQDHVYKCCVPSFKFQGHIWSTATSLLLILTSSDLDLNFQVESQRLNMLVKIGVQLISYAIR